MVEAGAWVPPASDQWAVRALDRAMWQSAAAGTAIWASLLGILVAGSTSDGSSRLALLIVHVVCIVASVVTFRTVGGRRHDGGDRRWFPMGAMVVAVGTDLVVAGTELALVAVVVSSVLLATPALVMARRSAAAVVGLGLVAVVGAALTGTRSEQVVLAVVVTTLTFAVAAGFLRTTLLRYAATVDVEDAEVVRERERSLADRAAVRARAHHEMLLHDTVVNTLGAVASGSRSARGAAQVRERCRRDLEALDGLIDPTREMHRPLWEGLGLGLAITVRWDGDALEPSSGHRVTAARAGIVRSLLRELLLNADKHSGADVVHVQVHRPEERILEITVTDAGRGLPAGSPAARRLADSLERRVGPAGDIAIAIDEAVDVGTTVRVRVPMGADDVELGPASDLELSARRIRRTSTWGWCIGVLGAGSVSSVVAGAGPLTVASLGLVGGVCALVWRVCGLERRAPTWAAFGVVAAVPLAYLLAFAGVSLGEVDPVFWPGIALTPLFVIALNIVDSRRCVGAAVGALLVTASVAAASVLERSATLAAIALVNAAVNLAQVTVWVIFVAVLAGLTHHGVTVRVRRLRQREERAAAEASMQVLGWWREAQVEASLTLVRELADGAADPDDAQVRRRAQLEEHHLRQLLLLGSQLVHLGPWLARCIGHGREQGLLVTVRVGDRDVADAVAAQRVGRALLSIIERVRPGSSIVVAYFGGLQSAAGRVTVVGPRGFVAAESLPGEARLDVLVDQDLVTVPV